MSKWKIFGVQTNIGWFDVKTKFKQLLRKITYSAGFQELICLIIFGYMKLVFCSSKRIFINEEIMIEAAKNNKPIILCFWHNRLMMVPFAAAKVKKLYPNYDFITLASRHGDGQFVGKIMKKLGLTPILGSSKQGRKASRGIDIAAFKKIFVSLKNGNSLAISPDGPRGPNQKINGQLINIARISNAGILAGSCSSSRFKKLKTWDKFTIPLPFSTLCFYFDEAPIYVSDTFETDVEEEKFKNIVEERMNFTQEKSLEIATKK